MRGDEVRAAGAVIGEVLGEITDVARGVHRAVAARTFRLLGAPARPVRLMHDGIAAVAYASTRLGVRSIPTAAGLIGGRLRNPAADSVHDLPGGRAVVQAVNGILGDRIAAERAALAPQLRLRTHDGRLRRIPANVAHDVSSSATGRIAIFLHGLCETDRYWHLGARRAFGDQAVTYGSLLRDEHAWTPLYASYNTGLHVSENGGELAERIEELVAAWPVPVADVALVGHSMGGLVARSAAHQAAEAGHTWIGNLRHIVGLGTPHLGAPLERFANWGSHTLARLPETRPFSELINRRSVGIKDMRYGAVVADDWTGCDPDELLCDRCTPARLLPDVGYFAVAATLTRRPDGPFSMVGDLLVQHASATGTGLARRIPFEVDRMMHIGRRHHFHLLADPLVYQQLRTWLV